MNLVKSILAVCLLGACSASYNSITTTAYTPFSTTKSYGQTYGQGCCRCVQQQLNTYLNALGHGQLGPGQLGPGQLGHGQLGPGQLGPGEIWQGQLGRVHMGQGQSVAQYLGCFKDGIPRVLPSSAITSAISNSPQLCIRVCAGFKYAGVQYKDYCFCGNDKPATTLSQADCNQICPGDRTKNCGGTWASDVYTVPNFQSPNTTYKGCFQDQSARVLSGTNGHSATLTPEQCANMCYGFKYAGVENANYCFCGDTLPPVTVPEAKCNGKCTGDTNRTCGGYWTIAVYEIHQAPSFDG